jgi:murein DD-endopeptidase MepM/ murein hydrolase activator NlpD
LDIPLYLAGNFGELRNNHFHSGIDIKTNGVEGLNVYAVADGYVSRIKISAAGYGNALYITHPNGYLSLYGHLQSFTGDIAKYVRQKQYEQKSFEIDIHPNATELPLLKGDIIAISGNSGSSGGAHLHFELRDAATEEILNPLLFGFDIKDDIAPVIRSLSIYPLDSMAYVNYQSSYKTFTTYGSVGKYNLGKTPLITVYGQIGFAFDAFDRLNMQDNQCGIYSAELYVDSQLIYSHELEKFSFDKTRSVNSHIDYEHYIKTKSRTKSRVQKCFVDYNNQMGIYKNLVNYGQYNFNDNKLHHILMIIKDVYGNTSSLNFNIQSKNIAMAKLPKALSAHQVATFPFAQENWYATENFKINIPANTLYDTLQFEYYVGDILKGCVSTFHHVHNIYTPSHGYFTISLKADIPEKYYHKAVVTLVNEEFYYKSVDGTFVNGWMVAQTREFGNYTVRIDTLPPKINPINIVNNKNLGVQSTIKVSITDNLSGIKSYNAYIDDKWELMIYDQKYNLLTLHLGPELAKGKHTFKLVVEDQRENSTEYSAVFVK